MHIVTFVSKYVHNNAPDLFKEYFVKTSHNYSTKRNGDDVLLIFKTMLKDFFSESS